MKILEIVKSFNFFRDKAPRLNYKKLILGALTFILIRSSYIGYASGLNFPPHACLLPPFFLIHVAYFSHLEIHLLCLP